MARLAICVSYALAAVLAAVSSAAEQPTRDEAVAALRRLNVNVSTPNPDYATVDISSPCAVIGDDDLKYLAAIRGLRRLTLSCDTVTDAGLAHLKSAITLKELSLSSKSFTEDGLEQLAGLTTIEELQYTFMPKGGDGLKHLAGMKKLATLNLDVPAGFRSETPPWKEMNDAFRHLPRLPALRSLKLPKIGDAGLANLPAMPELEHLTLGPLTPAWQSDTRTREGIAHLAKFKKLQTLQLRVCDLSGDSLASLTKLYDLRTLQLFECTGTDDGLRSLRGANQITTLMLFNTDLTDAGVKEGVAKLSNLKYLHISRAKVSDAALPDLEGLKLSQLNVRQTDVTEKGVEQLLSWKRLPDTLSIADVPALRERINQRLEEQQRADRLERERERERRRDEMLQRLGR